MMPQSMQTAALLARALWGNAMGIAALHGSGEIDAALPRLDRSSGAVPVLYLPPQGLTGQGAAHTLILASAAHAAAHVRFSPAACDLEGIKPLTQMLVGLLEDARAEGQAMAEAPGLRALWQPFHDSIATGEATLDGLLRRLARALFDPLSEDTHPWIAKGRELYRSARNADWSEMRLAASILGNDIAQMRIRFDPAVCRGQAAYRDDNTHLWRMSEERAASTSDLVADEDKLSRQDRPGSATSEDEAATVLRPLGRVAEWDRLSSHYRQDWCALFETQPRRGKSEAFEDFLRQQADWVEQCARRIRRAAATRAKPVRASAGAEFDDNALLDAGIAWRARSEPDPRVYLESAAAFLRRHVVFILDASVSTAGQGPSWLGLPQASLLQEMAAATTLACAALERVGHVCSIIGFNSNTRHKVRIQPIKDEYEPVSSSVVLARLAGLQPEWSTRSGAAVRYALRLLQARNQALIVLVTDGEPHDADIHDPQYLPEDLRRAGREARQRGITLISIELAPASIRRSEREESPGLCHVPVVSLCDFADALIAALAAGR